MGALVDQAIRENRPPQEVARVAMKEAIVAAGSEAEKENLAASLYKDATGRFPQNSMDRKTVYVGGFWLAGCVFLLTMALVFGLVLAGKPVPDWIGTLATALASGVIGGLFGYAQQG